MENRTEHILIREIEAAIGGSVMERSVHFSERGAVMLAEVGGEERLLAEAAVGFAGTRTEIGGKPWTLAPLNHTNALLLRKEFPFTAPVPVLQRERSIGVGDRLGLATEGHIRVFEQYDAYPVFAQQSIRELTLTERSFEEVLDCVSYAVFRADYRKGFGADGDHLKNRAEVAYALSCGYTMVTLDCSEYIHNDVYGLTDAALRERFPAAAAEAEAYVGKAFSIGETALTFTEEEYLRAYGIYHDAVVFASEIYAAFFAGREGELEFEVSIDETSVPTAPLQHFYFASELLKRGVKPATIAPRFCGEFQKGIDYIGNVGQFEDEMRIHAAIAKHFGYKISVHSGSDKFSVFPAVGRLTEDRYHLKTAGTNWLEAMALIAEREPGLYREVHRFALEEAFPAAKQYYHVTTDLGKIPALDTLSDAELPALFTQNDARQLIHITYGQILTVRNGDGSLRFRDRLYAAWKQHSEDYALRLEAHISRHLDALGCAKAE